MTEIALIDATCEALGHPVECTEPAPGNVVSTSTHGITVTDGGTTKEVATISTADISIPDHAHTYDGTSCIDVQSHTIDPDTGEPSITINGSPVYLVEDAVTTDPTSGGNVNINNNTFQTDINRNT